MPLSAFLGRCGHECGHETALSKAPCHKQFDIAAISTTKAEPISSPSIISLRPTNGMPDSRKGQKIRHCYANFELVYD